MQDLLNTTHPSWHSILSKALATLPPSYLDHLQKDHNWLPGFPAILRAFSLPLPKVKYILFGESPYPRAQSANGYAFWDAAVTRIWSDNGALHKTLNRATSLRNFMKMLLVAEGYLQKNHTSPADIQQLDHTKLIQTLPELFERLLDLGFLLLNANLVLSQRSKSYEAAIWQPFMRVLLAELAQKSPGIQLVLFGKIAELILSFPEARAFKTLIAEHPYNLSFIHNPQVAQFFGKFKLLAAS